jgi:hypothetical protein
MVKVISQRQKEQEFYHNDKIIHHLVFALYLLRFFAR